MGNSAEELIIKPQDLEPARPGKNPGDYGLIVAYDVRSSSDLPIAKFTKHGTRGWVTW